MKRSAKNSAAALRRELLRRAEIYVTSRCLEPHVYRSLGKVPTVLFRRYERDGIPHHGNFHDDSFIAISADPEGDWARRLEKAHSGKSRCFLERDAVAAREMDSCTSSDALAMNLFCHPSTVVNEPLARLFGFNELPVPEFGFDADLLLTSGKTEPRSTEIDLKLHSPARTMLAECKLTERDFTARPLAHVERYESFTDTFDVAALPRRDGKYLHYQLIRNVLAARHYEASFCLICDERRRDLQESLAEIVSVIVDPKLQRRCSVITWQQIAATVSSDLQTFLAEKYGIE